MIYISIRITKVTIVVFLVKPWLKTILLAEAAHPILIAFSLVTNGKKILQVNTAPGQILCFNGLKVISLFWVIVGHRFTIQNARGIINYDDITPASAYTRSSFILRVNCLIYSGCAIGTQFIF